MAPGSRGKRFPGTALAGGAGGETRRPAGGSSRVRRLRSRSRPGIKQKGCFLAGGSGDLLAHSARGRGISGVMEVHGDVTLSVGNLAVSNSTLSDRTEVEGSFSHNRSYYENTPEAPAKTVTFVETF